VRVTNKSAAPDPGAPGANDRTSPGLCIAGETLPSRLLMGTGGMTSFAALRSALEGRADLAAALEPPRNGG